MTPDADAQARTRAFARVMGPFLIIVPGIVAIRAHDMGHLLEAFFANDALVWITGGLLVFAGLLIVSLHQIWSSAAAILISLFGWVLLLRGVTLLAAPNLILQVGEAAADALPLIRLGFGLLVLAGFWLTYAGWIVPDLSSSAQRGSWHERRE